MAKTNSQFIWKQEKIETSIIYDSTSTILSFIYCTFFLYNFYDWKSTIRDVEMLLCTQVFLYYLIFPIDGKNDQGKI